MLQDYKNIYIYQFNMYVTKFMGYMRDYYYSAAILKDHLNVHTYIIYEFEPILLNIYIGIYKHM